MTAQFDTGQRFGAYELGKLLGRGGMGVVYQAQHVHLGRTVALKLLAPDLSGNEDFRARFLRESRLAATLDHPGIVTIYDAGDIDGVLYLAMRFVRGTDLSALLTQRAPLDSTEALSILDQVAAALDAAHASGLVHRDVKPANVMIEGQRCYLTDFGLTKRASEDSVQLTAAGQFLGTVDYIAPEQIEGRKVDGRADQYALGCVLFECLTGSRPYPRDSQVAVIYAQLREPPPRASELRPDLPEEIDAVIDSAMAKKVDERYSSCGEMVIAARKALAAPQAQTAETQAPPLPVVPTRPRATPPLSEPVAQPPSPPVPETAAKPPEPATAHAPEPPTAALPPESLVTSPLPAELSTGQHRTAAAQPPAAAPPAAAAAAPYAAAPPPLQGAPPGQAPPPEKRRSNVPFIAAGAVALIAAAVVVVLAVSGGSDNKPTAASTPTQAAGPSELPTGNPTPTTSTPPQNAPGEQIPVGKDPLGVVFRGDSVWVSNTGDNTVTRVAIDDNHPTTIPVGDAPADAASNTTSVWVANSGSDSVTRINAANGKAGSEIPVGPSPFDLTAEDDFVYVSNGGDDTVSVIDAKSGDQVGNPIEVGGAPRGITTTANPRIVWVANSADGTVSAIVGNKVVSTITTGAGAANVAFGEGSLWVSNEDAGTVSQIDIANRSVKSRKICSKPFQLSNGEGFVWVACSGDNTVVKIDPASGKAVGKPISVPGRPVGIAARDGAVWVTSADTATLTRLEP